MAHSHRRHPEEIQDPTGTTKFWTPQVNTWAFGVGAIIGTMGASVIFNMKGMILLELPGPRLLLMMKANLLAKMPELGNEKEGNVPGRYRPGLLAAAL